MSKLRLSITMSLDGYVAGPEQSQENPLGIGGTELHEWVFAAAPSVPVHPDAGPVLRPPGASRACSRLVFS